MRIEEFLALNNITVRPEPKLPPSVRACCYHDDEGRDYVLYNPVLAPETALRALEHELRHIVSGDMYDPSYDEYGASVGECDLELLKRLAVAYTKHVQDMAMIDKAFRRAI